MEIKNKIIVKGSLGFAVGILVGVTITAVSATLTMNDGNVYLYSPDFAKDVGSVLLAFILEMLGSGIYGAIGMGGAVVYDIEEWSLLKATIFHFLLTTIFLFFIGFALQWMTFSTPMENLILFGCISFVYFIIWQVNSLVYKHRVKQINLGLAELKKMLDKGNGVV